MGKNQKRKSTESLEDEGSKKIAKVMKEDGQSPSKKQKKDKQKAKESEIEAVVPKANGETAEKLLPKQNKRLKSKQRKLAAIARIKEQGGVPKPLYPVKNKNKAKGEGAGEQQQKDPKVVEQMLKAKQEKREKRKEKRKEDGQYKVEQVNMSADMIRLRIQEIKNREVVTKTAKRKLAILLKKLAIEEGTVVAPNVAKNVQEQKGLSKSEKRRIRREKKGEETEETGNDSVVGDPTVEKPVNIQSFEKKSIQKGQIKQQIKGAGKQQEKIKQVKTVVKIEPERTNEDSEEDEDEDEEEEEEEEDDQETELNASQDTDADEESDDEEDVEEDAPEAVEPLVKKQKVEVKPQKEKKAQQNQQQAQEKKKRYVLFVGNIPYE